MREAKLQATIEALHQTIGQFPPAVQAAPGKEKAQESDALAGALRRTLVVYRNQPAWPALMARGMAQDFSWAPAAEQYLALYRTMLQARGT